MGMLKIHIGVYEILKELKKIRALIAITRVLFLDPNHVPKPPLQSTTSWGLGFQQPTPRGVCKHSVRGNACS